VAEDGDVQVTTGGADAASPVALEAHPALATWRSLLPRALRTGAAMGLCAWGYSAVSTGLEVGGGVSAVLAAARGTEALLLGVGVALLIGGLDAQRARRHALWSTLDTEGRAAQMDAELHYWRGPGWQRRLAGRCTLWSAAVLLPIGGALASGLPGASATTWALIIGTTVGVTTLMQVPLQLVLRAKRLRQLLRE
jgi:hypothetical protein